MSIVWAILALGLIILVHELGHYLTARWMGVHVEVFSIGYGKRLFGRKIGETDFRVSIFPLGGYARMYGDITEEVAADMVKAGKKKKSAAGDDEVTSKPKEALPVQPIPIEKSFLHKPRWRRAIILFGGGVFNVIFAILVIWGVNLFGREVLTYREQPPVLGGVVNGTPAMKAGLRKDDRIISINGKKVETWEQTEVAIMLNPEQELEIQFERSGRVQSVKLRALAVTKNRIGYIGLVKNYPLHIGKMDSGSEAEKAGLRKGDIIREINGEPVKCWTSGIKIINGHINKEITLKVERDGEYISISAVPRAVRDEITGKMEGRLGFVVSAPTEKVSYGLLEGLGESIKENLYFGKLFVVALGKLVRGVLSFRSTSGPVEVTKVISQAAEQGALPFIWLVAFISLNLGLVNLAPIPMFDGGSLLILGIEGLRRKDFSLKIKERVMQVGFFMVVALFVTVLYFDLIKLFD